jgi:hypothetical protein
MYVDATSTRYECVPYKVSLHEVAPQNRVLERIALSKQADLGRVGVVEGEHGH